MPSIFARAGRKGVTLKHRVAGRTRMRAFSDREAAEAFLRKATREDRLGRGPDADTTVEEHAARWFRQVAPALREGSRRTYASSLRYFVRALGQKPLRRLGPADIKDLLADLLRRGLTRKTAGNVRGLIYTCLQSAVEDMPEVLAANPAAFRSRLRLRQTQADQRARVKALTIAELRRFLTAARKGWHYPIFRFMSATGCRPGEALGLQWADVDLAGGKALIRRSLSGSHGTEEATKSGHAREVDLAPVLRQELKQWGADAKVAALRAGEARPWVFSSGPGPLRSRALEVAFKSAASAAGLPPWHTPHHLRHSYASQAIAAGESIYYVQRQLGHARIQLTVDLYGSGLPPGSAETADRIEERALGIVTNPVTPKARKARPQPKWPV